MAREKLDHSLRVQLPKSLAEALKREAERRFTTVSTVVRMELAKAFGLVEEQGPDKKER